MRDDRLPLPERRLLQTELTERRKKFEEFIQVMQSCGNKVIQSMEGTPILLTLIDNEEFILERFGDEQLTRAMRDSGVDIGIQFTEAVMGTNAISLSLAIGLPVQLVGPQHYHKPLVHNVCYSVPFSYTEQRPALSGAIAIMTTMEHHSPFALTLLINMAEAIERELLLRRQNREQYLLHHLILQSVNSGIIVTDQAGVIMECNASAAGMVNRRIDELIGESYTCLPELASYLGDSLKHGTSFEHVERTFTLHEDTRLTCLIDSIPIRNESGWIVGAYLQARDMTERHNLERQIMTYEKLSAVGKLAAGLAHEIRNPLTVIIGFMQLLQEQNMKEGRDSRYLSLIQSELHSLNRLVSEFVLMAKPSSPERRLFELGQLAEDTISFMSCQAKLMNTVLTYEPARVPVWLHADEGQIKQVLINLLQNAMDAMAGGGSIRIMAEVDVERRMARLLVRDTGCGMTEKQCREVFTPFYSTKDDGLGLGLSICYRIMEAHGGRITLQSAPGRGTTFVIELPAAG
ncbi:ATP-binding protein [Paenibacillus sp. GCM10023252]|uniref:ATP-binding protein n=1 Tax=Paenibacillus sp. GCM10023252 TaxID=3252649 RepID=UPI0036187390